MEKGHVVAVRFNVLAGRSWLRVSHSGSGMWWHVVYEQQSSSVVTTVRTASGCKYSFSVSQDLTLEAKDKDSSGAKNEGERWHCHHFCVSSIKTMR